MQHRQTSNDSNATGRLGRERAALGLHVVVAVVVRRVAGDGAALVKVLRPPKSGQRGWDGTSQPSSFPRVAVLSDGFCGTVVLGLEPPWRRYQRPMVMSR